METMLLQRERTRASAKRGPMKHAATEEEDDDEENDEESIAVIMGSEASETAKMESLDLIKAVGESFAAIHSALRPSLEILPAELSDTVAAVNKDIFASKTEGAARQKKLDPKAILGGEGVQVLQAQKSVASLRSTEDAFDEEEPEEKPKKKVVRKVVKKVVKKKAAEPEEDLLGGFGDAPTEPAEQPEEDFGEPEEKPKKKVVRKVVKKIVKKKSPEPEPEEDLLGGFGDAPAAPAEPAEPEEDLLGGFGDAPAEPAEPEEDAFDEPEPEEKPKKKIVKKIVKKVVKKKAPEPEEDLLGF